jgi:hypothetical protein
MPNRASISEEEHFYEYDELEHEFISKVQSFPNLKVD